MNIDNQKSEMAVRFNGQLRAYINSACMEKTDSLYETSIVLAVEEEEKY